MQQVIGKDDQSVEVIGTKEDKSSSYQSAKEEIKPPNGLVTTKGTCNEEKSSPCEKNEIETALEKAHPLEKPLCTSL